MSVGSIDSDRLFYLAQMASPFFTILFLKQSHILVDLEAIQELLNILDYSILFEFYLFLKFICAII